MNKYKLADRMNGVVESSTLKMNSLAKEMTAKGMKVINLTAGEPDFAVLDDVKKATVGAIDADFSKYTPVAGIPELKKAISDKFLRDNGLKYAPDQILVSTGAKHSLFNFFLAVLSPGDEVIVPSPYWVSYPEMVKICGGTPVIVEAAESNSFKITPEQLKKAVSKKTKAFILNSPSNPTGTVYTRDEMTALAKVLEGTDVLVISDEIYEKLIYDGSFTSFAQLSDDAFSRTITVNGFSKAYAMTGWRLGYAAGPKAIIDAMTLVQGQSTSNAASIIQKAGVAALALSDSKIEPMVEVFKRRRNLAAEILSQCKYCSFVAPKGAFYFFLNIEPVLHKTYNKGGVECSVNSSEELAFYLLDKVQVVTVAGSGFGSDKHLRLSFAVSDQVIEEGAKKIVHALNGLCD